MPSPSKALFDAIKKRAPKLDAKGKPVDINELLWKEPDKDTTNIRNVTSRHWTPWLLTTKPNAEVEAIHPKAMPVT